MSLIFSIIAPKNNAATDYATPTLDTEIKFELPTHKNELFIL